MDVCTIIAKNYAPQARVLGASLKRFHPDVRFHVLVIDEVEGYLDEAAEDFALVDPHAIGLPDFERMASTYDLLELSTAVKPWLLQTLLRDAPAVVYLDPDMCLYAPLDELFAAVREHEVVLSPHNLDPMPRDGRRPNEQDILIAGAYNLGFIGLARGARTDHLLSWWAERLEVDCIVDPQRGFFVDQRWIDLVPGMVEDTHVHRDRGFNVAYWNLASREITRDADGTWRAGGEPLRLFHFSGFDARRPQILSKHQDRIELSAHPDLAALCAEYAERLVAAGAHETAAWPYTYGVTASGIPVNRTLRELFRRAVIEEGFTGSLFDPQGEAAFFALMNAPAQTGGRHGVTRYLAELWRRREDLQRAYPRLDEREDAAGLIGWARVFGVEEVPEPLKPPEVPAPRGAGRADVVPTGVPPLDGLPLGVNVCGYLQAELGVGEVARQAVSALDHEAIPVLPIGLPAPFSRQAHAFASAAPPERGFGVNLLCVNADMTPQLVGDLGAGFFAGRYSIGWWWWEVERFPERWMGSFDHVDEVWTGSAFVRDVLSAVSPVPVVRVPVPVSMPTGAPPDRAGLGLPEGPLFLFLFDHHSVFERKNPLGLIEAFVRAFPRPGEATLVIKSINGEHHPADRERLRAAAAEHPHVVLMEEYLSAAQKTSLLAGCDAYVSLHRSEGFGMTMAEAMLLRKPVIATAYSGNLDFMTPENGLLVRHELGPIGPGADPYPPDARWAHPDLDHAAELMRRVVEDPDGMRELGERAAEDVWRTNGLAVAGAAMAERLRAIQGRVPPHDHDFLRASADHANHAIDLLEGGSRAPAGRSRPARAARKALLRALRPHTAHQARVDRELIVGLGDAIGEMGALRSANQRQVMSEAMLLANLRRLERDTRERLEDLSERLDAMAAGGGRPAQPVRPAYTEAPAVPWTHEYNAAHRSFVAAELEDAALLERLREDAPLPDAFGTGFDERVIEFPWVAAARPAGRVLDAGSALNHHHVLERLRPLLDDLHVVTLAPEDASFPELGISYLYADLRELPMRDGAYDGIVCISTLEHVGMDNARFGADRTAVAGDPQEEAERAVAELWRVLRPGGELLVTVPVGTGERFAWVRSLTPAEVDALAAAAPGASVERRFYRHAGGWQRATAEEVASARYRDHLTSGPPVDRVVAAEAIACLRLVKPA